ncbi:Phosphotransferase enzyme family [Rubrobacter radiotolerans]|uniref:Phosphotransferase enzyme family n=1 Tax=Rubrobacter radiotolerans TaxID=42256 RepID=A0A023X3P7_RUBRA|nr:Phosphotransferase enzyme family [Rubrobacter radiotolerans]
MHRRIIPGGGYDALARAAIARYGRPGATHLTLVSERIKRVYRARTSSGEEFALRLYPARPSPTPQESASARFRTSAGLRSTGTVLAQLDHLRLFVDSGLAVPSPVVLPDGSLLGELVPGELSLVHRFLLYRQTRRTRRDVLRFVLLRWLAGTPLAHQLNTADLRNAGRFIAELHEHSARNRPSRADRLPVWDWEWSFGETAPIWTSPHIPDATLPVLRETSERVRDVLRRLGTGGEIFGAIHRDLTLHNLLVLPGSRGPEPSVGAIDFDLLGLGHYGLDLLAPVSSLRQEVARQRLGRRELPRLREALLSGYSEVRDLPRDLERTLDVFRALKRVAMINARLRSGAVRNRDFVWFVQESARWLRTNLELRS